MRGSLRHTLDFRRVHARGRRGASRGVSVVAAPRPEPGPSRLGLAVRVGPAGSVDRNRTRRRLRAAFGAAGPTDGFDVVVRAGGGAGVVSFQELVRDLQDALRAAGVPTGGPR